MKKKRITMMAWCPRQSHTRGKDSWDSHPCHQQLHFHLETETHLGCHLNSLQKLQFCLWICWTWKWLRRYEGLKLVLRDGFLKRSTDWISVSDLVDNRGREGRREFPFLWVCEVWTVKKFGYFKNWFISFPENERSMWKGECYHLQEN